jgi:aminoglycoside phosphotransferase (APT) family kinase protein
LAKLASSGTTAEFLDEADAVAFDRVALSRHLATCGIDFDPTVPIRQFAGGLANRNYLIEAAGRPVVMRCPPAGDLPRGAHDMGREHRVLRALSTVLEFVPDGLHYCPDPAVLAVPFQLVEYRPGLVIRGADLPAGLPADAARRLSRMLIETLAAIHRVVPERCGLGDLGRPEGFIQRTISGWRTRGLAVADHVAGPLLERISAWLADQRYEDRDASLLHLDFKLDNIVLDPETLAPRAVLDWDMGTRGDAGFDLATLLSYWTEPCDPVQYRRAGMMPTYTAPFWSRNQAATCYAELSGQVLGDLRPLRVLALMKLGVVFLQLHRQWAVGGAKGQRHANFRARGRDVLRYAWDEAVA